MKVAASAVTSHFVLAATLFCTLSTNCLAQTDSRKAAPKARTLTSADFGACRAELEENFRLAVAEIRNRMAARAAVMERQRPNVSKWDQDKQDSDQRFLDTKLQQGPMEIFGNAREVDETRAAATKTIKDRELENRLLRSDPGGDQIKQIVGITFTQETAAPRIAFNLAFICVMNLRLAQLDGKPIVRAAPPAPGPSAAGSGPVPTVVPERVSKTDPLSAYTLCVTAVYAELIGRFPNPPETMTRSRIACDAMRSVLESDVRQVAGSATPQVMLGIDVAILKSLRAAFQ